MAAGASLYIRPLEIGISAQVGVKPAKEYMFIILVTPVGPYFKEGFKPTNICVMREFDRVAPKGTGRWKVGGNYAASLERVRKPIHSDTVRCFILILKKRNISTSVVRPTSSP